MFQFDPSNLYSHILSVKFRAHPRANRRLTLKLRDPRGFNPLCADDNWVDVTGPNCKKNFEVKTYTCTPNDQNKGNIHFFLHFFLHSLSNNKIINVYRLLCYEFPNLQLDQS